MSAWRVALLAALGAAALLLLRAGCADSGGTGTTARPAGAASTLPATAEPLRAGRAARPAAEAAPDPPAGLAATAATVAVRGVVLSESGATAGGGITVLVLSSDRAGSPAATAMTDETGRFVVSVLAEVRGSGDSLTVKPESVARSLGIDSRGSAIVVARQESPACESVPVSVSVDELGSGPWIALRLRSVVDVRVRALDAAGKPVPRARVLVSPEPVDGTTTWDDAEADWRFTEWTADDEGVASGRVPPRNLRVWAASPDGPFGAFETMYAGRGDPRERDMEVRVGSDPVRIALRLVDREGVPVADAAVRLEFAETVQRFVGTASGRPGDTWVTFKTDEAGDVSWGSAASPRPLVVGIAHPGFETVSAVIDRHAGGEFAHLILMNPRPEVVLRVSGHEAETLGEVPVTSRVSTEIHWARRAAQATQVILGDPQGTGEIPAGEVHPAAIAECATDTGWETWRARSLEHRIAVPGPGAYRVTMEIPGCPPFNSRVVVEPSTRLIEVEWHLPPGRAVTVLPRSAPDSLPLPRTDLGRIVVWPDSGEVGAGRPLPGTRLGMEVCLTRIADPARGVAMWLPHSVSRVRCGLAVARTLDAGATVEECVVGSRPDAVEVGLPRRTGTCRVRVELRLGDRPLAESGIEIELFARGNVGASRMSWTARSDESGTAEFVVPPGSYRATIGSRYGPLVPAAVDAAHGNTVVMYSLR